MVGDRQKAEDARRHSGPTRPRNLGNLWAQQPSDISEVHLVEGGARYVSAPLAVGCRPSERHRPARQI
jgi:hypothetical protein